MAYARGIVVAVVCLSGAMFVALQFTWAANEKVLCGKTDSKSTFLLTYKGNLKDVSTHGCSPTIANAFNALKDMNYLEPICTMSKVKKITSFYEICLNEQDKRCFINKKSSQPIKELARYAILYGMETGDSCKQIMNEQLDSGTLLDESNVHALKPWINDDGQIARLIKLIPDRLISFPMPSDFSLLDPEFEDELMEAVEEENN